MRAGLLFALVSAASFGLSGSLGTGLIEAGWSPGSAVTVRILVAVVVLAVPAALALRGQWLLLRRNLGFVTGYGLAAVATAQLGFFNAVAHMPVGVALLIEYTAPVAVDTLQPPGKKMMNAVDWARGARLDDGAEFS
jgi:drug/metabolite transporter (DMT)-like permease